MMDCYLGMIVTFAFDWAPNNFAACNGQSIPVSQNQALFSLLGIKFGGNGQTNFNLPDLRGRTAVHYGQGATTLPRDFAASFGQETMTLTQTHLPSHTHALAEVQAGQTVTVAASATVNASTAQANVTVPQNTAYWAKGWDSGDAKAVANYANSKNATMASDAVQVTVTPTFHPTNLSISPTGNGAAFALAQPSLALNFCICTMGIYPERPY